MPNNMINIFLTFLFFFLAKLLYFCKKLVKLYSIILITRFFFDSIHAIHNTYLQWPAMVLIHLTNPYLSLIKKLVPETSYNLKISNPVLYPPIVIPFLVKELLSLMLLETLIPFILECLINYFCQKSFIYFFKI